jgi:hypothetical protein
MGHPTLTRTRRESSGEAVALSQKLANGRTGPKADALGPLAIHPQSEGRDALPEYAVQARSGRCLLTRCEMLANQSNDDQNQDDHEQDVNQIPGLGNPWDARRSEVSKEPENEKNDNDRLEHIPSRYVLSGMSNTGAD